MDLNRSFICHIDLSVFSCSLSQFLSLVFSSCSEVNCLHKSSLEQTCLLSLAFWIYTLFCFILWNYSSGFAFWTLECFLSTEDCLLKYPAICVFFGPFFARTFTKLYCIWTSLGCIFMFGFTRSQWLKVWESDSHFTDLSSYLSSDPDFMVLLTENCESNLWQYQKLFEQESHKDL